ncbi:MAG: SpoIIE family protein phosphatase [Planctomycetota bacterium]
MHVLPDVELVELLDSFADGVYVCDTKRRITYWSKSAEQITGWRAEEVVGRHCYDGILCHEDMDGHRLCGGEYCPLHRAMVTQRSSEEPKLVYLLRRDGRKLAAQTMVSPVRDASGTVIGGVEVFRNVDGAVRDLEKARRIQTLLLPKDLPHDERIGFSCLFVPQEVVSGDFYAIEQIGPDSYGIVLADVMGHGTAAALYTMYLSSIIARFRGLLDEPARFVGRLNEELSRVIDEDTTFATAVTATVDLARGKLRFAGGWGPPIVRTTRSGDSEYHECRGLPLGLVADFQYEQGECDIAPGDSLLFFSDGATEVRNRAGEMLGVGGFLAMLLEQGYPQVVPNWAAIDEGLLKYSDSIRLDDDVTIVEARLT